MRRRPPRDPRRGAAVVVALLAAAVLAGLVALWPGGGRPAAPSGAAPQEAAEVRAVREARCELAMRLPCRSVEAALRSGPDAGRTVRLTMAGEDVQPRVEPGDRVRLARILVPEGAEGSGPPPEPYAFADFERRTPVLALVALFALLAVALGRARGVRSLLGLAYVGASLPVLLVLEAQGTGLGEALNLEDVAGPVVGMLVGSIGLMLAVPLTTALAALLARRLPPEALPAHGHAH